MSELAEQRAELRWQQGHQAGEEKGWAAGLLKGEANGIQIGEARGELRGEAKTLLLRSRGLDIPAEVEKRITECSDAAVLASWLSRVATVGDAAELLAG